MIVHVSLGMIRPRVPPNAHQMMPQRPPFGPGPFNQPNHPANMRHPIMNPSMPPRPPPMNAAIPSTALPLPLIGGPRKVLINPNFKGGVQAATSKSEIPLFHISLLIYFYQHLLGIVDQLMMDTMKNSQIMENTREAELLRQQEAFINQNRMHIEKRRRSREHSPERDREYRDRDRERDRSYSPPRRWDRKPYPAFRDNRNRRPGSRERDPSLRKRSNSDGNTDKNEPKVIQLKELFR